MNLIAKLDHSYVVEYKDAWVDKVEVIFIPKAWLKLEADMIGL